MTSEQLKRRNFIKNSAVIIGGTLTTIPLLAIGSLFKSKPEESEEVSPNEDLMREHGALRRIILIYRAGIHRIDSRSIFHL